MGVLSTAEKNILKKKLKAEEIADKNLNKVLEDENVRFLFLKCKGLVVEIAKLEVAGKDAKQKRKEYNDTRELLGELLKTLGIDKKDLRPKYECDKCKDTGHVAGIQCDCLKREMSRVLIELSGVNIDNLPRFTDDFDMFDKPNEIKCIYDKMKQFIEEREKTKVDTILIAGGTGVGKTHLTGCMTTYAIETGAVVKFTTAFNLNQDMLKYHCAKLEDKNDIMEPYLTADILFVDDLGSENKIQNVTNEYLYLIINERMAGHKKTVITTNFEDFEQIQDVYGERVFSRLMHKQQSVKIKFNGTDLRIKGVKSKKGA